AVKDLPPLRTGVVNAVSDVVLHSARDAARAGVIDPVLFGDPQAIEAGAKALGRGLAGVEIVAAAGEKEAAELAARAAGRGEIDALMKGHVHTDIFMRAALDRDAGLRTGRRLAHVFSMTLPGRAGNLLISDAALNTHPDLETKKAIIESVIELAHAMGAQRPRIALLSATEEPTEAIPSSIEAAELERWAGEVIADADVQGPLALDLAVSGEAARIKGVSGAVVGRADALVVPDIVTGNALFKMMVQFMNACAAGIVLGAKVPILLTSRADPPAARLASAALAVLVKHRAGGSAG
ncbi:MAG: bifunctional enoyl-CoA hydratase/phosphate acetyltransferase, partial [Hyphomicrobiales bacterium]|nr:bifunctional enoyl-CoA hydratase/phosphate acetyltransferase [Hyphomicrobiales bacterium]